MRLGVTGHQDLPAGLARLVTAVVVDLFPADDGLVVVSSLAAGADQLVADVVLDHGGGLEVVLPCERYEATLGGPARAAFTRLLDQAIAVERLPFEGPSDEAYMAAGRRVVDRSDHLVALWDGLPSRGLGGTADVVAYAETRGVPVSVVWPDGWRRRPPP